VHMSELEACVVMSSTEWDWSEDDWPRTTIHGAVDRACEVYGPDRVGWSYLDEGVDLTFGEARSEAARWSAAFIAAGVEPGDRVAVCLASSSLWPVLQIAISQIGAVVTGVNTRYRTHELQHVLADCAPRLVVSGGDDDRLALASLVSGILVGIGQEEAGAVPVVVVDGQVPSGCRTKDEFLATGDPGAVEARRARVEPDDAALIQYTSGSTAAPKGVELSHDAVLTTAYQVMCAAGYDASDSVYSALPFYHVGGSICTGPGAFVCGARMVVPRAYDALGSVRQMIAEGCTAEQGHAAMFTMQIDAAAAAGLLSELRLVKGWAAAPPTVMRRIAEEMGITEIVPVYGMSEFGLVCAGSRHEPLAERLVGIGAPVPGVDVRLRPLEGSDGVGEMEVRGRQLLSRYRNEPEATALALSTEGWFRTGDLATLTPEGRIVFAGRAKDMIKPGGENVSAAEVEEFLRTHPGIAAVAVIAIADDRLGEAVAAVVQPAGGAHVDLAGVREFCAGRIASFKTPKAVFVAAELPLLANGKLDKLAVRERWGNEKVTA
jgi:fatty-acyl-CoA synthase